MAGGFRQHGRAVGSAIRYQLHIGLISFPLQFLQEARIRPFSSRPCAMLEIQPLLDLPLGERPVIH